MNMAVKRWWWSAVGCLPLLSTAAPQVPAAAATTAPPATTAAPATTAVANADKKATAPTARKPKATDHVELDQTTITGNRELPNVMVIVPWKESGPGEPGKAGQSLLDEALLPLDREEFRRELRYQEALRGKVPAATPAPAIQLPKPPTP